MKLNKYLTEFNTNWIYILQDKNKVFSATTNPVKLLEIINRFTKDNYNNASLSRLEMSGEDVFGKRSNKLTVYKKPIIT